MVVGGIATADSGVLADVSLSGGAGLTASDIFPLHCNKPRFAPSIRCGHSQKQLASENYGSGLLGLDDAGLGATAVY